MQPENLKKPPLGLRPKFIVDAFRIQEIESAMLRYIEAHKPIPIEWVEEYNQLLKED